MLRAGTGSFCTRNSIHIQIYKISNKEVSKMCKTVSKRLHMCGNGRLVIPNYHSNRVHLSIPNLLPVRASSLPLNLKIIFIGFFGSDLPRETTHGQTVPDLVSDLIPMVGGQYKK